LSFIDRIAFISKDFFDPARYFVAVSTCLASSRPLTPAKPEAARAWTGSGTQPPANCNHGCYGDKITFLDIVISTFENCRCDFNDLLPTLSQVDRVGSK